PGFGGGAIFAHGQLGTVNISSTTFSTNLVTGGDGGGAIDASGATISDCSFFNNEASGNGSGGAIFCGAGTLTAHFNRFFNDTAAIGGNEIFNGAGMGDANDNWWGQNSGPVVGATVGIPATRWL